MTYPRAIQMQNNRNKISDAHEHASMMPYPQAIQMQNNRNKISDAHEYVSVSMWG